MNERRAPARHGVIAPDAERHFVTSGFVARGPKATQIGHSNELGGVARTLRRAFAKGRPTRGTTTVAAKQWRERAVMAATMVGALAIAREAAASPAVDGTRNLSLGSVARSSSFGTNAALLNPSNMGFTQQFSVEPLYQFAIQSRTHGIGMVIMDSLNNQRVSIGLGYTFMKGAPKIEFLDSNMMEQDLKLSRFGHEAFLAINVLAVKNWLAIAVKGKYQYTSLRYRDALGVAHNAHDKLNAFGLDLATTVNLAGWAALSVVANNLVGNHDPAFTDERPLDLPGIDVMEGTIDPGTVSPVSDYPLSLAHGLAVFPLHNPDFSLNFDGTYDFTTYEFEKHTRLTYGGSAEFVVGPVPLRFGTVWDNRGKGRDDDRVFVAGGIAYVRPAPVGGVGIDVGVGFRQDVLGARKETVLGLNIGVRIHPDL